MARANRGKAFEDVVKKAFEQVPGVSIDRLRDAPKKLKNVDNPSDFIVYKRPHEVYVECKSHKGNTLPFSCIRQEQIEGMHRKAMIDGVKAGIIVWFIDHDVTVWVSIDEICYRIDQGDRSINVNKLDQIEHIAVSGKKKRIYFDYDMEQFLEDLYDMKQLYCRDCKWWCGQKISIGRKCMNTNRKTFNVGKRDTHLYKYPCTKACKTGFEPKEDNDEQV